MDLFKLGKDKNTGKILEITEVEGGLNCNCVCPNCDKDLVAAQGEKTEWYFRHHQSTNCDSGPEMGIKELVKEIFTSNSRIKIPSLGVIKYENAEADKKPTFLSFPPDLSAETKGGNLYFQIKINDEVVNREKAYKEGGHKSIEIDLTDYVFTSKNDLRKDLLNDATNKRIIFWQEEASTPCGNLKIIPTVFGLLGAGMVLGVLALSRKDKNQNILGSRELMKSSKNLSKNNNSILGKLSKILDNSLELIDKPNEKMTKRKGAVTHFLRKTFFHK